MLRRFFTNSSKLVLLRYSNTDYTLCLSYSVPSCYVMFYSILFYSILYSPFYFLQLPISKSHYLAALLFLCILQAKVEFSVHYSHFYRNDTPTICLISFSLLYLIIHYNILILTFYLTPSLFLSCLTVVPLTPHSLSLMDRVMLCFAYCTILHCTALHCTVLYCV